MNLSEHFTYEELTRSDTAARLGLDNTPGLIEIQNLRRVAALLEEVRKTVSSPVMVTSGYRSKTVNDAVGSKDTSQHRLGCAADFRVPGMTPREVVEACMALPYDQIILEFDSWTHISVPNTPEMQPRHQALIIDKTGTRIFS